MLGWIVAAAVSALPAGPALTDSIRAADQRFFALFFEGCDPARLREMTVPDLEMYHDRDGLVARSAAEFVADYAKGCEAKKQPNAWRSRRELDPATLRVFPLPGYGAIEEGAHFFYERRGNGPEKKVGWGRFVQVWRYDEGVWRLARILSYDHKAVN